MQSQLRTPSNESKFKNVVKETLANQSVALHLPITFFTPGDTWDVIRKLPNRIASGPDDITNCVLKYCGNKTITRLCIIFNLCLRAGYFPTEWKHEIMIMIRKLGKHVLVPVNHHPISLLNTLAKVLERMLLVRLKTYTIMHTHPKQHGFRQNHNTTTQLLKVVDQIAKNLNFRLKIAVALLDVKKAFDKV